MLFHKLFIIIILIFVFKKDIVESEELKNEIEQAVLNQGRRAHATNNS